MIHEEVVSDGAGGGHFTSFRDGRIRCKFYDRTILELSTPLTPGDTNGTAAVSSHQQPTLLCDIVEPSTGKTIRYQFEAIAGSTGSATPHFDRITASSPYRHHIHSALAFRRFTFLSEAERVDSKRAELMREQRARAIVASLEWNRKYEQITLAAAAAAAQASTGKQIEGLTPAPTATDKENRSPSRVDTSVILNRSGAGPEGVSKAATANSPHPIAAPVTAVTAGTGLSAISKFPCDQVIGAIDDQIARVNSLLASSPLAITKTKSKSKSKAKSRLSS